MAITNIGSTGIQRTPTPQPHRNGGIAGPSQRTPGSPRTQGLERLQQQVPAERNAKPAATATQGSLPVEPPAGTDPALWSVLSAEERGYFAKAGAMGPLTYGRVLSEMKTPTIPVARGGRLDVKI